MISVFVGGEPPHHFADNAVGLMLADGLVKSGRRVFVALSGEIAVDYTDPIARLRVSLESTHRAYAPITQSA